MQITLVFQAPKGDAFGDSILLEKTQTGLIPNIGDHVVLQGNARKIKARFFTFHPVNTRINFEVE
jgi:hypothetical protein